MPSRKSAIPLLVDVDGLEVAASLRPPRSDGDNYRVRWKIHGVRRECSTGTRILAEAKRVGRLMVLGEPTGMTSASIQQGMTVAEFQQVQREHHARNARPEAGASTLREFLGIWRSFLRVCPITTIQEVTERLALRYLRRLQVMSKSENRECKTDSPDRLSVKTVKKHIRTLAAAWNLVREGHPKRVGGLAPHQLVQANPWQAIRNNLPQDPVDDVDPVQFELVDHDLERFLDQFVNHPIGELFIITSLWCWGRIREMSRMEWGWLQGEYVVIPRSKAKRGRGKIARLPPAVREGLEAIRDHDSPYVFARWVEDVRRNAGRPTRVEPFAPDRMMGQMEKLIADFAAAIGRPEISHHSLRRTAMELGEEAELRQAEKTSAEKLQTTTANKRRNYTKRFGKKAYTFADGLYSNLTVALHDHPALAKRLGCEPVAILAEREAEALMGKLTHLQRQRLARRLLGADADGDNHGVA